MSEHKKEKFKITFDAISCWGGAVVIIGSMFKILHLKGASIMITIGLSLEAMLFFLSGFRPPHKDPDWVKVYPQLADDYPHSAGGSPVAVAPAPVAPAVAVSAPAPAPVSTPAPQQSAANTVAMGNVVGAFDASIAAASNISPETIKKLGDGLKGFSEKVEQISGVANASVATNEFATKVKDAANNFDSFNVAFKGASEKLSEVASSSLDSSEYKAQVEGLTKNLTALNTLYELELQESGAHLKSMATFYKNMANSMQNLNDSVVDAQEFKDEVRKLSRNLASLNSVYGNMLSAVNTPRS